MIIVLDASVAAKWFFHDEPNVILARHVLSNIEVSTEQFLVPDLFFIELNAVLIKKSEYDFHFVKKAMELILRLGLRTVPSLGDILQSANELACNRKISVYDGIYLALAESVTGRWLTADLKAKKRIKSPYVISLDEYRKGEA